MRLMYTQVMAPVAPTVAVKRVFFVSAVKVSSVMVMSHSGLNCSAWSFMKSCAVNTTNLLHSECSAGRVDAARLWLPPA